MRESIAVDGSIKRLALGVILVWAILGTALLRSPVLLVYVLLHAASTGLFLYFFLRKENCARKAKSKKQD